MIERQKRLIEVYEHLRRYFGIHTKTGFAEAIQYGRTSLSAAMNGDEKYLTDSLFKNICEAYKGVFDLNYLLTGEGELLTAEEYVKFTADIKNAEPAPASRAPTSIDPSSAVNAIIAAYVELTNHIKQEMADRLADKDARINDLLAHLREQEDHIATLQSRIADLARQNASLRSLDPTTYPFPIGAAENRTPKNVSP